MQAPSCSVHALACCFLLSAAPAIAQPSQAGPLDPVLVTATRTESRVSDLVAEVTVIDRAAIERATGRTLTELLARQPGLQVSANGGLGKASSLFIRGLEARHTLLLVDGVRLGSATVGTPSWDNIPLAAIERIEIVRGPLSALYGSDAVGCVVQVFTRRGLRGPAADLQATVGSNGHRQLAGGLSGGSERFDLAVGLADTRNRGFSATGPRAQFGVHDPDADGFRQTTGTLRLGWRPTPAWRVEALALESRGRTQYDDGPGTDSRAELHNAVQALSAEGPVSPGWRTRLSVGRAVDVYDTRATASRFTPLGATRSEQRQIGWENAFATPLGVAVALVERIDQDVSRPGVPYAVGGRSIDAVGASLSGEAQDHAWQAGLRHDRNSQFGAQTTGSVGYGYAFGPAWRIGGSWGTSFVAPSFNQLYFPGFGNPALLPEEGRHGELSLRWSAGGHAARAAYVDNRIRGYIPSGPLPANVPNTRIDGWVLSYEARLRGVALGASYERLDPRNVTEGSPGQGRLLPRRAREALRADVDWQLGTLGLGASLSAFSARYEDVANRLRLAGFATLDLRADWSLDRHWTLGLRLNNLADKAYETAYGFNQPGREAYLTLRWTRP